MKFRLTLLAIALSVSACDRTPATTTVISTPGPAGPQGESGAQGATGDTGATGETGGNTVIIVPPPEEK